MLQESSINAEINRLTLIADMTHTSCFFLLLSFGLNRVCVNHQRRKEAFCSIAKSYVDDSLGTKGTFLASYFMRPFLYHPSAKREN